MNLYARVFKDPQVLDEMLHLRQEGWSITALAEKYDCNFTSVWHQCRKKDVIPVKLTVMLIRARRPYLDFDGTPVSRGKSYKQYLKEAEERKRRAFAEMLHTKQNHHQEVSVQYEHA